MGRHTMKKNVLVLPGDGIGQEVCEAALPVISAMDLPITLTFGEIGWACWTREGNPVPDQTWEKIAGADAVLLGAITSKGKAQAQQALPLPLQQKGIEYVSSVIQLRQKLGLFANIRPVKYVAGDRRPFRCCVIRENTEGLYAGMDFKGVRPAVSDWLKHPNLNKYGPEEAAWTVRLQTRYGLERLFQTAFEYARKHHFTRVTFADKPNVMRESGHFAGSIFHEVAARFPEITADIHNVDAIALWLVRKPHEFGVIVAENMFGDILSDLAAGVMGGLGLAPSANIGSHVAYFEPVHGSAPGMAGQGKANPCAMFYTIALMLEYLGFESQAEKLQHAVDRVVRDGKVATYDLGGTASTREMAQAIIRELLHPTLGKTASVITIGDELLSGQYPNSNQLHISQRLEAAQHQVRFQASCADNIAQISALITSRIGQDDLIVICGGLGPTSDDKTREAVAQSLGRSLIYDEDVWATIQAQLRAFGVKNDPSNRQQARFPDGASVLDNPFGTAPGFYTSIASSLVVVLPGPPSQALPMLDDLLSGREHSEPAKTTSSWTLIGISESEVGSIVSALVSSTAWDVHFLWKSPYVIVQIETPEHSPLPLPVWQSLDRALRPYLVSKRNKKASEILQDTCNVRWQTADVELSSYLPVARKKTGGEPVFCIDVAVNPYLVDVLESETWMGQMTMSVRHQDGKKHQMTFPLNKALLAQTLPEYAAWCVLKTLTIQNG
ncbi:isocitrate/isopropylmalate dehydrogenase family protein [Salmonella enterica]|nr:isocitrate/isopropylmalate dehydrogenase family protein [Salmonella enterica]EKR1626208.1 isocitrate/isopropylmalate dehydrogenase family protein [Salmonella enterica subsp. diarizonae serovar 50:k:z:[z50],[z57],[z68], [z86]]UAM86955.1 isocitrate/isopropylmalate dehydrogenase family protein [Salmonella enterica subsp. arizonae]EIB1834735.1 isocitrate/isopropylmalate dehydrogenase family protein [Salmonella enterica]EIP1575910.1 isocitrate/isopropylmalate dehydrogenase family protein [Salmone